MTSTAIVHQGPSPEEDYGLDAIAKHNAATSTEQFPTYQEDAKGLGIYVSELHLHDLTYTDLLQAR